MATKKQDCKEDVQDEIDRQIAEMNRLNMRVFSGPRAYANFYRSVAQGDPLPGEKLADIEEVAKKIEAGKPRNK